jgi:hypothetical protein
VQRVAAQEPSKYGIVPYRELFGPLGTYRARSVILFHSA